jgi:hypothetical protein
VTVGFNATRRYRDGKAVDLALLVVGTVIVAALIAWAMGAFT